MANVITDSLDGWTAFVPDVPVAASTHIYQGHMVCPNSSGLGVPAADTSGYKWVLGVANEERDNSSGASGDLLCKVRSGIHLMNATSVTQAMVGSPMYVVNSTTVDDIAGVTNAIFAGIMVKYVDTTHCYVLMGPAALALNGVTASAAQLNKLGDVTGYAVQAQEATFTETTGAGTYTGSISVPAGATLIDIIVHGVALWTATTSATMKVGDATDDDGYFTGIDLKATDLLAGESLSFALAGGKAGADIAGSQANRRYSSSARTISGIVTTVGAAGSAGRTRMEVLYVLPTAATAATKA